MWWILCRKFVGLAPQAKLVRKGKNQWSIVPVVIPCCISWKNRRGPWDDLGSVVDECFLSEQRISACLAGGYQLEGGGRLYAAVSAFCWINLMQFVNTCANANDSMQCFSDDKWCGYRCWGGREGCASCTCRIVNSGVSEFVETRTQGLASKLVTHKLSFVACVYFCYTLDMFIAGFVFHFDSSHTQMVQMLWLQLLP